MKLTSKEWLQQPKYYGLVVYDPDGWDRSNYEYSFNVELITEDEFKKRLARSTAIWSNGRMQFE